ncbi:MAG: DUF3817 domain-containing protein [Myxococcota bacterium]
MNKWFQILGRLEGCSFLLLLLFAMPAKYYLQMPIGVRVLGPVHGILFLGYCVAAFTLAVEDGWSLKKHLLAYAAAVVPFGPFLFERYAQAEQQHQA